MNGDTRPPGVLLASTGLQIDGGIASVARCIARGFEELADEDGLRSCSRVLLHEEPTNAAPPPRHGRQLLAHGSQLRFVWQLWNLALRERPDFIFFDQLGLARAAQLPLRPHSGTRYAIFLHGIELNRAIRGMRRRVLVGAWRLLANSEFTAERVRREFPEVADRVRTVFLCLDPERVSNWKRQAAPNTTIPRSPTALIVGRMWAEEPGKGHEELLAAWPRVLRECPDAELWVAGIGDDRQRLEAKASTLGIAEAVHFLGRVSDEDLGRLYRRASVFAMPSRQEGFGLVYAEAMWHGLPCIASTADAGAEVVRDGETGLLVPYGDEDKLAEALIALLSNPERLRIMGEAALRRASTRFTYERFRREFLEALDLFWEDIGTSS